MRAASITRVSSSWGACRSRSSARQSTRIVATSRIAGSPSAMSRPGMASYARSQRHVAGGHEGTPAGHRRGPGRHLRSLIALSPQTMGVPRWVVFRHSVIYGELRLTPPGWHIALRRPCKEQRWQASCGGRDPRPRGRDRSAHAGLGRVGRQTHRAGGQSAARYSASDRLCPMRSLLQPLRVHHAGRPLRDCRDHATPTVYNVTDVGCQASVAEHGAVSPGRRKR